MNPDECPKCASTNTSRTAEKRLGGDEIGEKVVQWYMCKDCKTEYKVNIREYEDDEDEVTDIVVSPDNKWEGVW